MLRVLDKFKLQTDLVIQMLLGFGQKMLPGRNLVAQENYSYSWQTVNLLMIV